MSRGAAGQAGEFQLRTWFMFGVLVLGAGGLVTNALYMQLVKRDFLKEQGDARFVRKVEITANRGPIVDRNGALLAMSIPVVSVWADPRKLYEVPDRWPELAKVLQKDRDEFAQYISSSLGRKRIWLARQLQPAEGEVVRKLQVPGVYLERDQKRFYPAGEAAGHIVGFTNVDEDGQAGAEQMFDSWLAGAPGSKKVYQDNDGRRIEDYENIAIPRPGHELELSIDMRLQSLASRELKEAIVANNAHAGSIVMIDVQTGELLVMALQRAFNPNVRAQLVPAVTRNRVVTDIMEPGSSIKPFIIAAALQSGLFDESSRIDVSQGFVKVGSRTIPDEHPQGILDLTGVLRVSSNAAMAKISQQLQPRLIWDTLTRFGFGQVTASEFRGESAGILANYGTWNPERIASMSFGYGLSVTPLQLAQGYAVLGALGVKRPLTVQRRVEAVPGERVFSEQVSRRVIHMMESVVEAGTGTKAAVPGYRVSGKTGTARKSNGAGSYFDDRYFAIFCGVAPASNPRLAMVVVIDEPSSGRYYGGDVSAPVFSKVMGGALRLLGVPPDGVADPAAPATGKSSNVVQR